MIKRLTKEEFCELANKTENIKRAKIAATEFKHKQDEFAINEVRNSRVQR